MNTTLKSVPSKRRGLGPGRGSVLLPGQPWVCSICSWKRPFHGELPDLITEVFRSCVTPSVEKSLRTDTTTQIWESPPLTNATTRLMRLPFWQYTLLCGAVAFVEYDGPIM